LSALAFTYPFVKVGTAFGGGALTGMKLGLLVAILSPVIGSLYQYFSVTYMPIGLAAAESVFQVIARSNIPSSLKSAGNHLIAPESAVVCQMLKAAVALAEKN
jgi:hypothetical protein